MCCGRTPAALQWQLVHLLGHAGAMQRFLSKQRRQSMERKHVVHCMLMKAHAVNKITPLLKVMLQVRVGAGVLGAVVITYIHSHSHRD